MHESLYGYRKSTKPELPPSDADFGKFRNDELHITIFVHVDEGLLFSPTNCKTVHDLQEHKRWSCAEGIRNPFCMVTKTTVSELQFRWSRTVYPHNWNYWWIVTKHLLKELGNESREHLNSQSAKTWASKRGLGRMQHVMLQYMFVQDVMEEKQTTLPYVNTKSNKADMMTKCHTNEAHMKGCASGDQQTRSTKTLATIRHDARSVLEEEDGESRTCSPTNVTVSSEFTFAHNHSVLVNFSLAFDWLFSHHCHPNISSLLMNIQLTLWTENRNFTVYSHPEQHKGPDSFM